MECGSSLYWLIGLHITVQVQFDNSKEKAYKMCILMAVCAGYYFMDSPGNDLESIAGQVASGCNVIFFVTGNGVRSPGVRAR